jgi:hypothetical protein
MSVLQAADQLGTWRAQAPPAKQLKWKRHEP